MPSTIHRLLKSKHDSPYFHHDKKNPLNYDVVIVDECSMIDVALFAKLLDAIAPGTRVILLGDKDQLASVEAGSLFGDLCQSQQELNIFSKERASFINSFIASSRKKIPSHLVRAGNSHPLFEHLIELRYSHRFRGDAGIGSFSKAVMQNDEKLVREFLHANADPQVHIDTSYSRELFEKFIRGYETFIAEPDILKALRAMNNLRVLCAIREGEQGLYLVNKSIEKFLHDKRKLKVNSEFYENRPIILTRNYYDLGLFNGDNGIIRADEKGVLMAWFEDGSGGLKSVLPGYLSDAETAFAMTIHKSQGSEFNEVLVILPQAADVPILTRELLYTAVTRARNKVYLQATEEVLMASCGRFVERASGIATRFLEIK
jgi:exodeoxyribonuclease V alpha subunit